MDEKSEDKDVLENVKRKFEKEGKKVFDFISDYINNEGFLTELAYLLVYAGEERAENILSSCDLAIKEKLEERYKSLLKEGKSALDGEAISVTGSVLKKNNFFGRETTTDFLMSLSSEEQKAFRINIDDFVSMNPIFALNAEENIFSFDDIVLLDDRAIQKVLREIEEQELAKALKGVDREVQDKIFRNMSRRAAAMLQEDMEFMGPVRIKDVDESQKKIVGVVRRLEKNGEIVICRDFEEQFAI